MNDPIVNEIRKFRDEHAKLFNYDIKAICEDYNKKHSQYVAKLAKRKNKEKQIECADKKDFAPQMNTETSKESVGG